MPALKQGVCPALHISCHRNPWANLCKSQNGASDQAYQVKFSHVVGQQAGAGQTCLTLWQSSSKSPPCSVPGAQVTTLT